MSYSVEQIDFKHSIPLATFYFGKKAKLSITQQK